MFWLLLSGCHFLTLSPSPQNLCWRPLSSCKEIYHFKNIKNLFLIDYWLLILFNLNNIFNFHKSIRIHAFFKIRLVDQSNVWQHCLWDQLFSRSRHLARLDFRITMEKSTKNNVDFKAVFKETLNSMTLIVNRFIFCWKWNMNEYLFNFFLQPLMISGGRSNVNTRCNSNITLTDMRAQYASRVLSNIFAYKDQNTEIILTSIKNSDNKSLSSTITCVVGPVINPSTKKKDVTTSFEEYMR